MRLYSPGLLNKEVGIFYFKFNDPVKDIDKIILPKTDLEGKLIQPIERQYKYRIVSISDLRLDVGRMEYRKAHCEMEITV